jgi:hypothetical protein
MYCRICGEEVSTTSGICFKHIGFEYDSQGNLIARTDMVKISDGHSVSMRIPMNNRQYAIKIPHIKAVRDALPA